MREARLTPVPSGGMERAILEQMDACVAVYEPDGRFVYANRATRQMFGRSAEGFIGENVWELFPEARGSAFDLAFQRVANTGQPQDFENYCEPWDRWFDNHMFRVGPHVALVAREISTRKQPKHERRRSEAGPELAERRDAMAELVRSKQLTATIASNATLGLFMMDARQHCTFMNPAAEKITGFQLSEVQGRPLHYFVHHSHPDGTPYPMEECPIDRALPKRIQESGEDVFVHKDGHFYPVAFTASPIVEDGRPTGTVIEVRDTTVEKEIERQLRAAVAARDEFLSAASHELRTPLTAMILQLERLKKLIGGTADSETPKALKNLETVMRQTERLASLVEGLLDVSRTASGRLELQIQSFDLRELVQETVARVSALAERAGCEIRLHLPEDATGSWDRARLDQVLMNLLTNAIKYGPRQPIEVTVSVEPAWVSLSVHDLGIGISPEAQARIFGRFERAVSTSNYGGLGLGLFMARQMVEAHGGTIHVESSVGEGASFTVRLPRSRAASASRDEVQS